MALVTERIWPIDPRKAKGFRMTAAIYARKSTDDSDRADDGAASARGQGQG